MWVAGWVSGWVGGGIVLFLKGFLRRVQCYEKVLIINCSSPFLCVKYTAFVKK